MDVECLDVGQSLGLLRDNGRERIGSKRRDGQAILIQLDLYTTVDEAYF